MKEAAQRRRKPKKIAEIQNYIEINPAPISKS